MGKRKTFLEDEEKFQNSRVSREIQNMRHKDLQRACVMRGMPFEKVVESTTPELIGWFTSHYETNGDPTLLTEFDAWVDKKLKDKGYVKGDAIFHPQLKLGFFSADDLPDSTFKKKIPEKQPEDQREKPRREKDEEMGVIKGTKKALTYQCCKEGKNLQDTTDLVTEKFPEAQAKSIAIWYKRCQKELR